MLNQNTLGEKAFNIFNSVFMLFLVLITLYPLIHVTMASFSMPSKLTKHTGILLYPLGFTIKAYKMVFKNPNIIASYKNTIFYVLLGTGINLSMTILSAFVLSRKKFMFKNILTFMAVFTMFFQGGLIPLYIQVMKLGLIDNRMAMILPHAMSTFNLIVMRTSFLAVPDSLEESAYIEGANEFVYMCKILLPLSIPVVAVMILFYGVYYWNQWFFGMLFLRTRELYPLQLILREILINSNTSDMMAGSNELDPESVGDTIKYATIIISTLPILFVYPYLQKYFVKGLMVGAIKG